MFGRSQFRRTGASGIAVVKLLVLVVAALVAVGGIVALLTWRGASASVKRARAQLETLAGALDRYSAGSGQTYPARADSSGLIVYIAVSGDGVGPDGRAGTADDTPVDGRPDDGATVYLEGLDPKTNLLGLLEPSGEGAVPAKLADPWGNTWRYRGAALDGINAYFDLWSAGPDGKDGTGDDIRNW